MFKIGDFVIFGRPYGEKTFGRILKVNPASYLTASLESRQGDIVGVVYRVQKNNVTEVPLQDWRFYPNGRRQRSYGRNTV